MKPVRILLMSDSHGRDDLVEQAVKQNPGMDYYIHCGDSCTDPLAMRNILTVAGNCDIPGKFASEYCLDIDGHRILVVHGNREVYGRTYTYLIRHARREGCDMVFFGHIHCYVDTTEHGVRLLNPGSMSLPRDNACSYMRIIMQDGNVQTERVLI